MNNFNNETDINEDNCGFIDVEWFKIIIAFIIFVLLMILSILYYIFFGCPNAKKRNKNRYCCCFVKKNSKISPGCINKHTQTFNTTSGLPPIQKVPDFFVMIFIPVIFK